MSPSEFLQLQNHVLTYLLACEVGQRVGIPFSHLADYDGMAVMFSADGEYLVAELVPKENVVDIAPSELISLPPDSALPG